MPLREISYSLYLLTLFSCQVMCSCCLRCCCASWLNVSSSSSWTSQAAGSEQARQPWWQFAAGSGAAPGRMECSGGKQPSSGSFQGGPRLSEAPVFAGSAYPVTMWVVSECILDSMCLHKCLYTLSSNQCAILLYYCFHISLAVHVQCLSRALVANVNY